MTLLSAGFKEIRKELFNTKVVIIRNVLPLLLIPIVLTLATLFLTNEIESAFGGQSDILYSGPDDISAFIAQDPLFNFMQGDFEPQIKWGQSADIALEVDGNKAYIYFSPVNVSSIIAYERLSKLLSQYGQISGQGEVAAVYYETADQGLVEAGEGVKHSLYNIIRLLLASIASLFVFAILVSGGIRIFNKKATAFVDCKQVIIPQFVLLALNLFFASVLVVFSTFMSAYYLIPPFLPDGFEGFVLFADISIFYVLIVLGFMLGVSVAALSIYAHTLSGNGVKSKRDSFYLPVVFILSAIFLNLSAIGTRMPEWSNFVPILNLQGIIRDAIIYGLESGRLLTVIGINIIFSVMCIILSRKVADGTGINLNEKGEL